MNQIILPLTALRREANHLAILLFLLSGCAVDLSYTRENPGLHGILFKGNRPAANIEVIYAHSYSKACNHIIGTDTTDAQGNFQIPVENTFKLIELFPSDDCEFSGKICIADQKPWKFEIVGEGTKEYHTGGNIIKEPQRLLFMTPEGSCDPPAWLSINCHLGESSQTHCEIIGQSPNY